MRDSSLRSVMGSFNLLHPSTEAEAISLLAGSEPGETAILAGGTDLLNDIEERRAFPRRLLSLRNLPWNQWSWSDGNALSIGSTVPLAELEADGRVRHRFPGLVSALEAVGSLALRTRATLGGNLGRSGAHSDLIPILLTLDARAEIVGPRGVRSLPVDDLVVASRQTTLAPGELIRSILLPEPRPSSYRWQRIRPSQDVSHVAVAVAYSPKERRWRISLGGVPPRAVLMERPSLSLPPSPEEVETVARSAAGRLPLAHDLRASGEYRRLVIQTLVRRAVADVVALGRADRSTESP
jgi:CO/xanthine dehydrogenase FAD-binding subunit